MRRNVVAQLAVVLARGAVRRRGRGGRIAPGHGVGGDPAPAPTPHHERCPGDRLEGGAGLVAAHDGVCVTIETDTTLSRTSLRESLRARPETLRRLGWHYVRVHAFQLFTDPDSVAQRVAEVLGIDGSRTQEVPTLSARQHVNRL